MTQHAEEELGRVLELAHRRSAVRHNLLREATIVLGQLGVELADVEHASRRRASAWRMSGTN